MVFSALCSEISELKHEVLSPYIYQYVFVWFSVSPCCGREFTMSLNFQAVNKFYFPLLLFEESGKLVMHSGGSSVSQNKLPQLILGYIYILKYLQNNFIG